MTNEIKEILEELKEIAECEYTTDWFEINFSDTKILYKYITNLQEENKRLKEIAHKMHLWIFLHSDNEQKVYDEIGLTEKENTMLGYSGQFRLQGEDKE